MHPFNVKILSGPMYGIDVNLPAEDVFFLVGPPSEDPDGRAEHVATRAMSVLFIPFNEDAPNFMLALANPDEPQACVYLEAQVEHRALPLNEPVQFGAVWVAVKRRTERWSGSVLGFMGGAPGAAKPLALHEHPPRRADRHWWWASLIALLSLLVVAGGAWGVARGFGSAQVQTLEKALYPLKAQVTLGEDEQRYVLVGTSREAEWAQRAVTRRKVGQDVRIIDLQHEQTRLGRLLDESAVVFLTLRLEDPLQPVLVLSRERSAADSASQEKLRERLLEAMPYAQKISFNLVNDAELRQQARALLAQAAVDYEEYHEADSSVFVVSGVLDDRQISDLNGAFQSFRKVWGERYVRLLMQLNEPQQRGKSFRSGKGGYLLQDEQHWVLSEETAVKERHPQDSNSGPREVKSDI
ncbi:PrgH/EprH family type III secretion apparatus protein [Pseudomonas batumici]|uniref:PrgH/EprH family type III secretion apparatus protein n=1 Tax=Pseudomonas batumici TaxID=226910 RepID=UPI0030D15686